MLSTCARVRGAGNVLICSDEQTRRAQAQNTGGRAPRWSRDTEAWLATLPAGVRREVEEQIDGYIGRLNRALEEYFKRRRKKT